MQEAAAASYVGILRHRSRTHPEQAAFTFLADGEEEAGRLTFAELDRQARTIGRVLQRSSVAGERVLLVFPSGLEYVAAFLGCLYGGAVAVPVYPPRQRRHLDRLLAIVRDARPVAALTTSFWSETLRSWGEGVGELADLRQIVTDRLDPAEAEDWIPPPADREGLAFLQYTSGSTGDPKGVMVRHGDLLQNQEAIRRAFGQTPQSVVVGWLPLYHDMGLIGSVLQPLYSGGSCVLMSSMSFLQRPGRWLRAISRYRATTSGGPDFAYDLCARKVRPEEREGLDLRSWEVAFNGAEPVRVATMERFAAAFAPNGFRASSFFPCYGLAEGTLLVSGGRSAAEPVVRSFAAAGLEGHRAQPGDGEKERRLVGCGEAAAGQEILAVDSETATPCMPGRVGEIWVRGPSVAGGYWNRPEESEAVFRARLASGEGPFLRTGDLGFLDGDQLFITGRSKDLIILRGRNLYPQDVERAAEAGHPALRPGAGAAFGVEKEGEERLVLACELEPRARLEPGVAEAIGEAVRRSVAEACEARVEELVLLVVGSLPRTSSGKVRRAACRALYLAGGLEVVARIAGVAGDRQSWIDEDEGGDETLRREDLAAMVPAERRGRLLRWLVARVARIAKADPGRLTTDVPLPALGVDSLAAVEVRNQVEDEFGVDLPLSLLLRDATLGDLVDRVLAEVSGPAPARAAAPAGHDTLRSPLSWGQRPLWFLQQLTSRSPAANLALALRFRSPVDVGGLRRALTALADRHAALRTTFPAPDGEPVQEVGPPGEDSLTEIEPTGRGLQSLLDDEANRPFALDRERPWRALLVRPPGEEPVLLLVVHHIAVDFWSFVVLLGELDRLYPEAAAGRTADLPAAPGLAQYAAELTAILSGPEGERLWAFWRDELGPEPAAPELPADRPRLVRPSHAAASRGLALEPAVTEGLKVLARSRRTTLYTVLLTAYQTLLVRYSGRSELVVASPAAGRVRGRWAGVVGYLMNPLPLRARLGGDPGFGTALERTREAVLAALEHQLFPSHLLAERLQDGGGDRPDLFRVGFVHNRAHRWGGELGRLALGEGGVAVRLGGIEAESVALVRRGSLFELMLSTAEGADGRLHARLEAATDLFDVATVARLAGHWRTLLDGIAADPERRLSELPLLTAEEREQLLGEWSGANRPPSEGTGILERFLRLAAVVPGAPAVKDGDRVLTYGELDLRARGLARRLRGLGVKAEVAVGVCLDRSPEVLVAFFGVLYAGGAWVPLDPAWPAGRKALLLADAGAPVVLTSRKRAGGLPADAAGVLCLDELPESEEEGEAEAPAGVEPEQAAYIFFTSGSTGHPKGVVVSHRALLSYIDAVSASYGTGPADRVLQFSAPTFDNILEEIGIALTRGACLVLRDEESGRSPTALLDVCSRYRITVLSLPTTAWHELAETLRRDLLTPHPELRLVIVGGERPLAERLAAWRERAPGVRVVNTYGPTEAVAACTEADMAGPAAEPLSAAGEVSMGRPLANVRVHLLDRHLGPVPVGVAGEICVGGTGLARGYLGAAATAERFVPDPFAARPGGRLYRTGDLGRRRPDGTLEFVGRIDRQIKVRGFRVEPEEVEAVLVRHPAVREAAVVAVPAAAGGHRLVAWVVGEVPARELRAFLAERLPEFLIPSTLAALDALPRNAHGKVDRRALPDPGRFRPDVEKEFIEPQGPVEEVMAGICASALGLDRIGASDDLFELGCHSLLAARIVAQLREALQVELPLVSLFEAPTVAGLAARVEGARVAAVLPPVRPVPRDRPLPLSFSQERLWFLGRLDPGSASYHVPRAIRMRGPLPAARVAAVWAELVRRHEVLRTTFPLTEAGPVQVIHPPAPVPVPVVDLQGMTAAEEELRRWIRSEGARPFDIERGPLLRVRLFRLAPEEHVLLLVEHHLVHDGWTEGVLLRDFLEIYRALATDRPSPLPELPVQFADFAVWQREWLRGEVLERQLAWWTGHLAGAPELLELPTDRPRPAAQSLLGAACRFSVDEGLAAGLRHLARRRGVTLYMVFLATFQTLLWRISGREDLVVGTGVANRRQWEIEGMLGMVINTLAMRVSLAGGPSFTGLLDRVRRVCLGAYTHQDLPFEKVVEALRPARTLSYNPLFQVMFGFQDTPHPDLALPGLELAALEAHNRSTKFDLMMLIVPEAEQAVGLRPRRDESAITVEIEYAADLFDATTALRMAGAYRALLEGVMAGPERGLAELPFLSAAQRHQLLAEWSRGPAAGFRAPSVLALFEDRVAQAPEAIAVVAGAEEVGYGELDRRAGRIAGRLRAAGVGPEARVALLIGRGAALPAAVLGIWKAGGAFVPLDPSLPPARLALLLEDSGARALVTEEALRDRLAGLPLAGVALVMADDAAGDTGDVPAPPRRPAATDLAYLIYTSGTTGRPKAVMVEHGSLAHTLWAAGGAFGFSSADRMPCLAPHSFDIFLLELLAPLLAGGMSVLLDPQPLPDVPALAAALAGVSLFHAVPALMRQVVEEVLRGGARPALRRVFVGGEAVTPDLLGGMRRAFPAARITVLYGPTEAAIIAASCAATPGEDRILLGRPLPGVELRVSGPGGLPAPAGVPGELWIAGPGVARGYLGREDLTAERFVERDGRRWYRSGDRARWLADGRLEFLGRLDHQVKLRGFRIELGELEAALLDLPEVKEAVVTLREESPAEARLVAYVVPRGGELEPAGLRQALQRRLPDYMVPTAWVILEALPLTATGKVDRRALPAPDRQRSGTGSEPPRTEVEREVAGIWAELLGRDRVGAFDSFFDLGGHSLLATQALSRLRRRFGVEIPMRDLFREPTVAALAAVIEGVLAGQGARSEAAEAPPEIPPISRVDRGAPLLPSFAQERLWFLDRLQPGSAAYNVPVAVRLTGRLDIPVLAASLDEIASRHEVLRTTFGSLQGRPVQVIHPPAHRPLPVIDLAGLEPERRASVAGRLAAEEAARPFSLAAGPLFRIVLVRLGGGAPEGGEEHLALFTCHHIVTDEWTMGVLVAELAVLYPALLSGLPSPLPELPVQYADFAHWQRAWLSGPVLETQLAWWRRHLAGAPAVLELPADRPRPARPGSRAGACSLPLPDALTASLRGLARREGTTLFMTMLAAFDALLSRLTGQDDLVVGTPIANRTRVEIERLVGFFVNTLALRTDLSGDPGFRRLLGRVRETALAAYAHQDLPFEKVVEDLQSERDPSRAPVFQVVFQVQGEALPAWELPGLTLRTAGSGAPVAKFDLVVVVAAAGTALTARWSYSRDLFDAPTVDRMARLFGNLLEGIAADPGQRLSELPLLAEGERHQLLREWAPGSADPLETASEGCIHQRVEAWAARTPDAIAAVFAGERLSYGELNRRANRLAHLLRSLGVGPEVLVGLCLERSLDLVVAVLGVLKAGGAYLPLDPDYPPERLAFALADSRVAVLVSQEGLIGGLPGLPARVVLLDRDAGLIARESCADPAPSASPQNLAYVIYTSGSTGRPKGVLVEHGNLARLFSSTGRWYDFGPEDSWTLFHSYAFDFSVWEIWGALAYGGRLVVVPYATSRSPRSFRELLAAEGVTVLNQTPSAFRQLAHADGEAGPAQAGALRLRYVIFGGEALDLPGLAPWFERHGDHTPALVNMYGITETTVHVTCRRLRAADTAARGSLIGRAIPDLAVHVLDPRSLRRLPIGVPGEVFAGGAGVARGYLDRPELTAERFLPDPFASAPGARFYRSGDLARLRPDGDLEYLGRIDHQVKIRGFRIELGEVEAALASFPAVREAVVLARDGAAGEKRLVAWVTAAPGEAPEASDLRRHLLAILPDPMVPAAFVFLDALPRTPNGKLDRKALPEPGAGRPEAGREPSPPRNELERQLVEVWRDTLQVKAVGTGDDFFALGGNSILGAVLINRLQEKLGEVVHLAALFDAPTVAELAARLEHEIPEAVARLTGAAAPQGDAPAPLLSPIRRREDAGAAAPISFAQERLWFLDQLVPGVAAYNIPLAVRLQGRLEAAALQAALARVAARHESLRTRFVTGAGVPVQVVEPAVATLLPVTDLSCLAPGERRRELRRRIAAEASTPFDLAVAPLLRAALLRLEEREHVALLTVHHIVADGWSMGILLGELATGYTALAAGLEPDLPPLPLQYADFATWQRRELAASGLLEEELGFWRSRLEGAQPLQVPADRPRPAVHSFAGATLRIDLPAACGAGVRSLARAEEATPFVVLLAAFQALLHRITGQDDLIVGTPVAGRGRAEIEGLIGLFVNMLPIRVDASGEPSFRRFLRRVRSAALEAQAHQSLPFERLVEELQPERNLGRNPLFQVTFRLQTDPGEEIVLPGLRLVPLEVDPPTAKFDLGLTVTDRGGRLSASLEHATALFDGATARRVLERLEGVLTAIAANPEARIGEMPLLGEGERHQLLREWNDRAAAMPEGLPVHRLFEAMAAAREAAPAVTFGGERLSYAGLEERANRLAWHLRHLGVDREAAVAVLLERSPDLIVALLAVLKAGGVYVPLSLDYPAERLAFMVRDSGARILLTRAALPERPALPADVAVLDLGELERRPPRGSGPLSGELSTAALAYVVYTSGSTGVPKGVAVSHRAIVRLAWGDYTDLGPGDRVAQASNTSFDAATFEIWAALLRGAEVVGIDRDVTLSPRAFVAELRELRIDVLFLTTALLNQVVQEAPDGFASLRSLLFGGEAVDPGRVRQALEAGAPARLLHVYGPTESTTFASWHPVTGVPPGAATIPIGRPLSNTTLHVLDRAFAPVFTGATGELLIGGDGLARGYLNRPDLTAEGFVPDPFGPPGGRLYRTGDLVRLRPDGAVEFLGRNDHQIKLRGFRIELGEVEAALAGHPAVAQAVAGVWEQAPGDRRLIAWVVAAPGRAADEPELRAFLRGRLPEPMVPAAFVWLEAVPLTPNGKVDRVALARRPPALETPADRGGAAPLTPVEEVLVAVWADVLGREPGLDDGFFELGGHSLLATTLISRVRDAFGLDLPLAALFEAPTVAALAREVEAAMRSAARLAPPPAIEPLPRGDELPLSFAQERLWFLNRLAPESSFYNVPFVVRLMGELDGAALAAALSEIVRRHEVLRTAFPAEGGRPRQRIAPAAPLPLPRVDLAGLPEAEREAEARRRIEAVTRRPMDLKAGPLISALLLRLEAGTYMLAVTLHHIVSDGWSMGVLVREIAALYQAFSRREPSPLPELPVQYADFARWQRSWLTGEVWERQLAYWKGVLGPDPAPLELPTDHPRPPVQRFRGGRRPFASAAGRELRALGRRAGATLFMVLLAGFKALLHRYTGQRELLVGIPVANRTRSELEPLIGFFVNALIVPTTVPHGGAFHELLARVRESALGAYAHQDLPFEKLVEDLNPERNLDRNPLFQVVFVLQNAPMPAVTLAGLTLRALPLDVNTSLFDLKVDLWEAGDRLTGSVSYDSDLFEGATVARLAGHLHAVLDAAAADPGRRIADLPLLSAAEEHQILREWNDASPPARRDLLLHRLFERQAGLRPEAVAVVAGEGSLTYGELDARAGRLARELRGLGVGPEVPVALCLERSLAMVVAVLAVLKAGGAYVPLDPAHPDERLAFILEDCGAPLIMTQTALAERFADAAVPVLCVDGGAEGGLRASPAAAPDVADSLAYVIYTSGSTGRPKGVRIPHGHVVRLFEATRAWFDFGPGDVWTLLHSLAFDFSVWELFGALLHGGRLVIVSRAVSRSPEDLWRLLCEQGVTVLNQTPSAFRQLLQAEAAAELAAPALRTVIFGGEALEPASLRPWFERHGDQQPRLVNMYGITETTVHVTCRPLGIADLAVSASVVGKPLPDLRVHVLDRQLRPMPAGAPGEIFVGGEGVARGYLNRPGLTAERFVPDPLSAEPGARLYRTGDHARFRADGELEYLGRLDDQVKIRGFRIEPGEIEAALATQPAVGESAVVVREERGEKRLVAYVVLRGDEGGRSRDDSLDEQVSRWSEVFEQTYRQVDPEVDPELDLRGWTSSYTGTPISEAEMQEWVTGTVEKVRSLRPRRVLEIGCGTGLLLLRVAPSCERYVGTDFSRPVLATLRERVARRGLAQVSLRQCRAEELDGLEAGGFDLVILNSVVQYFPGVEYLLRVLEGAWGLVAPGGAVLVGDVRSLPLMDAFHGSVELERAEGATPLAVLRRRIALARSQEDELLLAPGFFGALRGQLDKLGRVEIQPHRGRGHNELTRFRYLALLRKGGALERAPASWIDWRTEGLTLPSLRRLLAGSRPPELAVRGVPNARLAEVARALELLEKGSAATVAELRRVARATAAEAVEPEDLLALGAELDCEVQLGWGRHAAGGDLDVLFLRRDGSAAEEVGLPGPEGAEAPWRAWANDPLQGAFARRTAPRLRRVLRERLPEHMVPSAFVVLDALPLTANGKVDRRELARREVALEQGRTPEGYAPPRGAVEETLSDLWSEVLGVDRIGREAVFFDLGGHSLLATQVISRVRSAFRVELPLQALFERPTVAALAEAVEEALHAAGRVAPPPLRRVSREGSIPLSFAQERLWFLHHLLPDDPSYNELMAVRLKGPLSPSALEWSAGRIALRHEVLRTTFPAVDGHGVQVVSPSPGFSWLRADLRGLPAERREAEARRLSRQLAGLPFDLARGPLLRPALVHLGAEESALLVVAHHIVFDGWSTTILQRELALFYRAFVEEQEPRLPSLPVQYADFAAWQRSWLRGEPLDRLLDYWRPRLTDLPSLELPTDRSRPAVASSRGARLYRALPSALAVALAAFARGQGATPFMVLLATFSALLSRLTGQTDLAVGTPVASRNRAEIEGLIGFFVNSLVLRVDASGRPGLRGLVDRVREMATGALSHQDLPFETLVQELQPRRDLGRNPLFQFVFQLVDPPAGEARMPGLSVQPLATREARAKFDLHLSAVNAADGMQMVAEYRQDLFDGTTMLRLLEHFQTLLAGALAAPDRPFPELPLLSVAERQQLAVEWNDTAVGYPRGRTVHALFAEWAQRTPHKVALLQGDERLSYGALEARANQLARHLRDFGVGPEVPVALVLPRSLDLVVALLGTLKAGGAYVPLDPAWPRERLAELIDGIGAPVMIARAALAGELERPGLALVRLDAAADVEAIAARSPAPLADTALPESLAYVLFTSGSTGVPKAVGVPHRAVVRLVCGSGFVAWGPDEVFLQLAPAAFDASTLEIWGSLLHGAQLALMPPETASPEELARALERYGVTTLWLTAGLFHPMVDEQLAGLRGLRHLLAGGDVLSPAHVRRALRGLEGCRVVNGYGPTENTTFTCCHVITDDLPESGPVPVGRPVASTRAYVLDDGLRPVPIGARGQLYAAGDGLSRGYLNQADETAAHFVPHPFGAPGERLYATGDLVRLLADGHVEFLGRNDRQLKLWGYRIEPGEVEALVAGHPGVREVVAGVYEGVPGDRRLVVWYVPADGAEPAPAELRELLKQKAPAWLVPSAFVPLERLPLTANGKVDRRALPAPDAGRAGAADFVAPRDACEKRLAALFGEVLGVERVGIHDDFFELGGYSLLATKMVSRIRDDFQVELPLRALFEAPSVADLARRLAEPGNAVPEEAPIQRLERGGDDIEQLLSQLQDLGDDEVRALLEGDGAAAPPPLP